jgi:hypothetical protein
MSFKDALEILPVSTPIAEQLEFLPVFEWTNQ